MNNFKGCKERYVFQKAFLLFVSNLYFPVLNFSTYKNSLFNLVDFWGLKYILFFTTNMYFSHKEFVLVFYFSSFFFFFCFSFSFFFFWFYFSAAAAAAAKSLQLCPTLCDPIDGSPSGSTIPGILQARTLEWVAISFSNAWKWRVKVKSLSHVRLLATPWTAAYQAPASMGFSRQEYWSGVPLP